MGRFLQSFGASVVKVERDPTMNELPSISYYRVIVAWDGSLFVVTVSRHWTFPHHENKGARAFEARHWSQAQARAYGARVRRDSRRWKVISAAAEAVVAKRLRTFETETP